MISATRPSTPPLSCYGTAGEPVDPITVMGYLKDAGQLDRVGGPAAITSMSDAIMSPRQLEHYAKTVKDKANLRKVIRASQEAMAIAYEMGADPEEALQKAQAGLLAVGGEVAGGKIETMQETVPAAIEELERRRVKSTEGSSLLSTGFPALDEVLGGGLDECEMFVVGARTSRGKTTLLRNIAANVAIRQGRGVLFVSQEQSPKKLTALVMCAECAINTMAWRSGNVSDRDLRHAKQMGEVIRKAPIYWLDASKGIERIVSRARYLKAKKSLALVIIDYLQLFAERQDDQHIGEAANALKAAAKELELPFIVASQFNRKVDDRPKQRPEIGDLRGSGGIEHAADLIALLWHPSDTDVEADKRQVNIGLGKARDGGKGHGPDVVDRGVWAVRWGRQERENAFLGRLTLNAELLTRPAKWRREDDGRAA